MKKAGALGRVLAVVGIATAAACSGGAPTPTAPPAATPTLDTPSGTAVVARLPIDQYGQFSWSPDGRYVLVGSQNGSSVYDRFGKLVSQFAGDVGWLDESHVLGVDGKPRAVTETQGLGYLPNQWVAANGRGTAYVVVAVPGCTGDPIVNRYRNGKYEITNEKLTPFGFSPDGDLALEGHLSCSSEDAELHGWKGDVAVVDVSIGRTMVTLHGIRGPMAFTPGGKLLAAQSDADVEIADIGSGSVSVAKNARLLAWITPQRLALRVGETLEVADMTEDLHVGTPEPSEILMPSPMDGVAFGVGISGKVDGVFGSRMPAPDLTGENLAIATNATPAATEYVGTSLLPSYWSPDGRMLALPTADRSHMVLISVDPASSSASPATSAIAATPTVTSAPTANLPAQPTLATALTTDTQINYVISIAPLVTPLNEETAAARAKQIGKLVGLTKFFSVYQDPSVADGKGLWRASFIQTWEGIPVSDSSAVLDLRPDGTVDRFFRDTGPRAPKPAKPITQAQAERAVPQMKVTDAQLLWDRAGTEEYHLVWLLRHTGTGGGPDWGGAAWIDAGTGKILQPASVS